MDAEAKIINDILFDLEQLLWEREAEENPRRVGYTMEGFRGAIKIFMSSLMDKMWDMQSAEEMDMEDRINMAQKVGEEVRKLIKTYTGIDSHDLYKTVKEK
jgi:hypothetical protein